MIESQGELFDLGYQHYVGPREGRMRARKALWANGVRTVLGLGRGLLAKIFPILLFGIATGLAVVITIIASLAPEAEILDTAAYNQVLSFFMLLFAAIIGPDLLCPDRRDNVIHLYLVRPMSPTDYVVARWLALFTLLVTVVYTGQLMMFVGLTFAADAPLDYIRDTWLDIPRFIAAGFAVAFFATTLALAVSAFTTRRAYAQAFIIGLLFVSVPVAAGLSTCDEKQVIQGRYEGMDSQGNYVVTGQDGMLDEEGRFNFGGRQPGQSPDARVFFPAMEERFTIAVDDSTEIEPRLSVGERVQVESDLGPDGSRLARRIGRVPEACHPRTGNAAKWIALVDLPRTPVVVSDMIFAKENPSYGYRLIAQLPDVIPIVWFILLVAGPGFGLWWRYQRITV